MYSLIRRLLFLFVLMTFGLIANQVNCQTRFLDVKPSLFTLRNSKLTIGIIGSTNITYGDSHVPLFQIFNGQLPNSDTEFDFESITFPYSSIGLSLDLFSANSRIGFSISGEYNTSAFSIINVNEKFSYKSSAVVLPFYLRYKFGNIHGSEFIIGRGNLFSSIGPYASIPINFTRTIGNTEDKLSDIQQIGYGISVMFGVVIRLGKNESKTLSKDVSDKLKSEYEVDINNYSEGLRFWLFLRADHTLTELFNNDNSDLIIPNSSNPFHYKVTNITLGAALFFGGKLSRINQ